MSDLAEKYHSLVAKGACLPNFPLPPTGGSESDYSHFVAEAGIARTQDHYSTLRGEIQNKYPGIDTSNYTALEIYFQKEYFKPVIKAVDTANEEIELIFPCYGTEEYQLYRLPTVTVKKMIEDEISANLHALRTHEEESKAGTYLQQYKGAKALLLDARRANITMRENFETIAGMEIEDEARAAEELFKRSASQTPFDSLYLALENYTEMAQTKETTAQQDLDDTPASRDLALMVKTNSLICS